MTDFEGFFSHAIFFRPAKRSFLKRSRAGASIRERIFSKGFANINQKSSYFWKKSFVTYFSIFQKNQKFQKKVRRKNKKKKQEEKSQRKKQEENIQKKLQKK